MRRSVLTITIGPVLLVAAVAGFVIVPERGRRPDRLRPTPAASRLTFTQRESQRWDTGVG